MAGPSPESEVAGDTKDGGDNLGDERRRRLIVDLDPPQFGRFTGLLDVPGTLNGWVGDRCRAAGAGANAPNEANTPKAVITPYQAANAPPPNQRKHSHGDVAAWPGGGSIRHQGTNTPASRQRQAYGGGVARAAGLITPHQTAVAPPPPPPQQQQTSRGTRSAGQELEEIFRNGLNEDQKSAVRKLVTAKDYALLLGMPGTGERIEMGRGWGGGGAQSSR